MELSYTLGSSSKWRKKLLTEILNIEDIDVICPNIDEKSKIIFFL